MKRTLVALAVIALLDGCASLRNCAPTVKPVIRKAEACPPGDLFCRLGALWIGVSCDVE